MLHTISWMVTREPEEARDRVRARILTWFLIGGVAGGALMGAMIAVAAGELFTVIGSRTTIFVANSAADANGNFADGMFAYAYIGGPFLVLTSDVGAYGTDQMTPIDQSAMK